MQNLVHEIKDRPYFDSAPAQLKETTHEVEVAGGGTIFCIANPESPWSAQAADRVFVTEAAILARFDEDHIIQVYFVHEGEYTMFDYATDHEVFLADWYRWVKTAATA